MRVDIATWHAKDGWRIYVENVAGAAWRQMVAGLERDGETVLVCRHARVLGKHVYQTPPPAVIRTRDEQDARETDVYLGRVKPAQGDMFEQFLASRGK